MLSLTSPIQDKLQMEESNTAVNLLKVNDGWRSILRQTRTAELRHDVTVLSQTFERHLDGLDCLLHNLEADIHKADQQAAEVRCVHVRNLKRLQTVQNKRLRILQQQWESGLQLLTSKFNSERSAGGRASSSPRRPHVPHGFPAISVKTWSRLSCKAWTALA